MSPYDALLDNSTALAKGKAQDITAKEKFKQELDQGKTVKAKAKKDTDDLDPNSDASKSFRQMLESVAPDIAAQYKANGLFDKIAAGDYDKIYQPLALRENIKSREQMAKENAANRKELQDQKLQAKKDNEPMSFGIKELDKQFAKDYNEWTGSGKAAYDKSLSRLKQARIDLAESGVGGRFQGQLNDALLPEKLKTIRDDVHAAAVTGLKAALGSQFTEREGTRIQGYSFNQTLSPAENLKKIDLAIKELEDARVAKEAKVKQFEAKGSLEGFKSNEIAEDRVEVISPDGEEGTLPRSQVEAAIKKGFRLK
jgi:AAA15 family ATPase/GTPase